MSLITWVVCASLITWAVCVSLITWCVSLITWAVCVSLIIWYICVSLITWAVCVSLITWVVCVSLITWVVCVSLITWAVCVSLIIWYVCVSLITWAVCVSLITWVVCVSLITWAVCVYREMNMDASSLYCWVKDPKWQPPRSKYNPPQLGECLNLNKQTNIFFKFLQYCHLTFGSLANKPIFPLFVAAACFSYTKCIVMCVSTYELAGPGDTALYKFL